MLSLNHIKFLSLFFRGINNNTEYYQINFGGPDADSSASCDFVDEVK